jgi:hypothetical protein
VGVAGVGIAVGAVTTALVLSHQAEIDAHCLRGVCDGAGWNRVAGDRTLLQVSTVAWIAGAVGVASAGYLWLTRRPRPERQAQIAPVWLGQGAGVGLGTRF